MPKPNPRRGGLLRTAARLVLMTVAPLLALLAAAPALALTDAELGARLRERFEGDRTGACAVAAVVGPQGVQRAMACADPRKAGAPTLEDAFEIGSISKTMLAFLVADLVEAGRWSLDDPIEKHLPPLPGGAPVPSQGERKILVRDLLTHSSGLPRLIQSWKPSNPGDPYAELTEQDLLWHLAQSRLQGTIGGQSAYSNFGAMLLSLAVARAHAVEFDGSFERALTARLFAPLKMDGAYVARPPAGVRAAKGHISTGEITPPWTFGGAPNAAGMGGVRATLQDMVRYAQAHLGLIDTPLAARLRSTQAPLAHGHGMHWMLRRAGGQSVVLHGGGTGGFLTFMALELSTQRAVILMVDTQIGDIEGLDGWTRNLIDGQLPVPKPRRPVPLPEALRDRLVGDYMLGRLAVQVRDEGGRLMMQAKGQQALELLLDDHGDLYPTTTLGARATPILEGGVVNRLIWRQGGGVMEAARTQFKPPLTAVHLAWQDWVGEYRITPQFSVRFFEMSGRLMTQGTGQGQIAAEVTGTDRAEVPSIGAVVEFQRNSQGQVTGLLLRQNGQVVPGARLGG